MEFILYLVLILLATKIAGDLSVRIGQPAVLGKLAVGIILGPAVLGWIQDGVFIHDLAQIGVLLLMFIAGLETDLDELRKNWKSAFAVAVGGIILPFIGGYLAAIGFGISPMYALFFGTIFSATSVSISVQVLKDMNKLSTPEGTTILGAAVVDDVLVVILLAIIMSMMGTGADISISMIIVKKAVFFIGVILAGWWLVPRVMKWLAPLQVSEAVITAALVIMFGFSYFAEWLGMAGILGAFAAGIAISQTSYRQVVESKVEPIAYSVFVPVFFVSIGLNVTFEGAGSQLLFLTIITVMAIFTKIIGCGIGARLTGFNNKSSLIIGAGMISRGEVALIIAATGLNSGILQPEFFTPVIIMVIITTLITPPLLKATFTDKKTSRSVS